MFLVLYNNFYNNLFNDKIKFRTMILLTLIYNRQDIIRNIYYLKNFIMYQNKCKILKNNFYRIFYRLPFVKEKVKLEIDKFNNQMKNELLEKHTPMFKILGAEISENGLKQIEIINILNNIKYCGVVNHNIKYVSGTIYNNNDEELELLKKIIPFFYKSNPLHPELFPQISYIEKNIIKSVSKIFHGDDNIHGCVTSGGTESIICAVYAYKNYGLKKGIKNPEIIAPISIHAAFDKAANYFGIKIHKIPITLDNSIDFNIVKSHINNNTILLACSAPSYAHGLIDDVESFSKLALKYNIPLHVDACLGGFLLPFLDEEYKNKIGLSNKYDFELDGVTSISADTHKYGYTPKGSSILMYRNEKYYKQQIFVQSEWNGGIYATPTIPGSRSGNNIIFTWAFLNYYGINGYRAKTYKIVNALNLLKSMVRNIDGVDIIGDPKLNVLGLKSEQLNIYYISSEMKKYGWDLNELQNPPSIHLCLTLNNCDDSNIKKFVENLNTCITFCRSNNIDKDCGKSIYGSTQKINNVEIIEDLAREYIKNLSN